MQTAPKEEGLGAQTAASERRAGGALTGNTATRRGALACAPSQAEILALTVVRVWVPPSLNGKTPSTQIAASNSSPAEV